MVNRFRKEEIILYITITIGYLIHWIHNDLGYHPGNFNVSLQNNLWQVVYIVGANFLFFEYGLPFLTSRNRNRVIWIVPGIFIHVILFSFGLFLWRMLGIELDLYQPLRGYTTSASALSESFQFAPGPFLVFAVCKLFFDYARLKYQEQQVRLEKKQAELVFLKSQINPHFLFNTLNNIYSLSQYQPHLVSESVLRLSKILRYLLYDANQPFITVDKEIKIVTDYIDLEKLRYSDSVSITLEHDIRNPSASIPPLLLLPLVENAFKHGVSVSRGNRFVDVRCALIESQLQFAVRNSVPSNNAVVEYEKPSTESIPTGIGLDNLKRRLSLLYKDFHFLAVEKEGVFTADLKINLSSHV